MDQIRSHESRSERYRTSSIEDTVQLVYQKSKKKILGRKNWTKTRKSVYATTYEVLVGLAKLIAPFAPFISEEIYQNLTGEESVHLAYFPKADESSHR